MTSQSPLSADALRDWLEALQSKSETPEVIALQRDLLALLQRAARQLPEVQALVRAARNIAPSGCDADALVALLDALKPFEGP